MAAKKKVAPAKTVKVIHKSVDSDEQEPGLADIATHADSPRDELAEAGDQSDNPATKSRAIAVAGTTPGELVEPADAESIIPLPEKPKAAGGQSSVRPLNVLPDGAVMPEPTAKGNTVRDSIRAGQDAKKAEAGEPKPEPEPAPEE